MSQNSLTLPTTGTVSGLQMTQNVNLALDTLNTLASGASSPGSPEAGQLWHDTTNNLLKLRSLDGAAWISLFSLNETAYTASPLVTALSPLRGHIAGLTLANDGVSPNTVIDVSAGQATSDDATTLMALASATTKNCNAAWAVGNGSGALDAGSSLAINTFYHLFLIERTDTGVVDVLLSTSATAPALPTSYSKKRRIGSIKTDGSAHILGFTQDEDTFWWAVPFADVNTSTLGTTASLFAINVPPGVRTQPIIRALTAASGGSAFILVTSPDEPDNTPAASVTSSPGFDVAGASSELPWTGFLRSNTSQQIRARSSVASTTFYVYTRGYRDSRGRFA